MGIDCLKFILCRFYPHAVNVSKPQLMLDETVQYEGISN